MTHASTAMAPNRLAAASAIIGGAGVLLALVVPSVAVMAALLAIILSTAAWFRPGGRTTAIIGLICGLIVCGLLAGVYLYMYQSIHFSAYQPPSIKIEIPPAAPTR